MKKIPLTQNKFALVDDEDYEYLMTFKWQYTTHCYAANCKYIGIINGKQINKVIYMHRLINNTPADLHTDHIDGNKLNNQKYNLRDCTLSQNSCNQKKRKGTSKYKGVYMHGNKKQWVSEITINRKRKYIGLFFKEIDAALAYNKAAVQHHGEFAKLNDI